MGWTLTGPALLQAGAALGTVLALVALAGMAARRFWPIPGGKLQNDALRIRATLALDARRRLHLLQTPAGPVLILTGGAQDRLVILPQPQGAGP